MIERRFVTLSLREAEDGTELDFAQGSFATEERRALHREGWTNGLDKLEKLVASAT